MTEHGLLEQQNLQYIRSSSCAFFLLKALRAVTNWHNSSKNVATGALGRPLATSMRIFTNSKRRVMSRRESRREAMKKLFTKSPSEEKETLRRAALEQRQKVENLLKMINHVIDVTAPKKRIVENKVLKGCKSNLFAAVQITALAPKEQHPKSTDRQAFKLAPVPRACKRAKGMEDRKWHSLVMNG